MKKVALFTDITGQDGSYLAEFLLEKGQQHRIACLQVSAVSETKTPLISRDLQGVRAGKPQDHVDALAQKRKKKKSRWRR